MNPFNCVGCNSLLDNIKEIRKGKKTSQYVICQYCGCINAFDKEGKVRPTTPKETKDVNEALFKILHKERWN